MLFSFLNKLSLFRILNVCFSLIMKFVLKPSLEHMALIKIGISLWNQNDVSALISKLRYMDLYPCEWEKIEEKVIDKVSQLSLPPLLKEKVFGVIKPIGIQILDWMHYYRKYDSSIEFDCHLDLDVRVHVPAELCWTPHGTVDRKRTAEVLVRDENLNVSRRYMLACDYCLEDDIIRFWNSLPENVKDYDWRKFEIISFWSDNMKRGGAGHVSYKHVFYRSAHEGNKVAAEYFLQKLTLQEREKTLVEIAKCIRKADALCLLLSKMDEVQQIEVLKSDPYGMLQCFLKWPWQNFFIRIANCMWDFLSEEHYDRLLRNIISNVDDGYKDCNYQKLFREFWQESPNSLKSLITNEIDTSWLLPSLFRIKGKENIRLVLKHTTFKAKEKLIYSHTMNDFCTQSIHDNEWDLLEFCIRECFPQKNEMLKFKEEFEKCMMHSYFKQHFESKKHEWDKLFWLSDDSIFKCNKRGIEEGESSSSKRFRSLQ